VNFAELLVAELLGTLQRRPLFAVGAAAVADLLHRRGDKLPLQPL